MTNMIYEGCGKTFSMIGDPTSEVNKGIIPRAFDHIVNIISSSNDKNFVKFENGIS